MGSYLNPGNSGFSNMRNDVYVDKTEMISLINQTINTPRNLTCISRPRRFGKSFAAKMLCAYYDKTCNSKELFDDLKIAKDDEYLKYLNQYDVIYLDMASVLGVTSPEDAVSYVKRNIIEEVLDIYPEVKEAEALFDTLANLVTYTGNKIIMIIDEWDAPIRENGGKAEIQREYLLFLRSLFKNSGTTDKIFAAVYMTGILPIKKDGSQSAISDFEEFTMVKPRKFAPYVGFTEQEVKDLCSEYQIDFSKMKLWYDGYSFEKTLSIYSPRSVVNCMRLGKIGNYWNQTETFEALQVYIDMNFEGLKDDVLSMIAGNSVPVNIGNFANDMSTFHTEDDVLTLLIHLGYAAYDYDNKTVQIPNNEVRAEYVNSVSASDWGEVSKALKISADTLEAIWQKRPKQVAEAVRQAHFETSHIQYNDENALSYTISLALYAARNFHTVHREFPGGKGFADLVFLPRKKFIDKPALVVELKWDRTAEGAINQIKRNEYCRSLKDYQGNLLLVGINYDRKTKEHECVIEEINNDLEGHSAMWNW